VESQPLLEGGRFLLGEKKGEKKKKPACRPVAGRHEDRSGCWRPASGCRSKRCATTEEWPAAAIGRRQGGYRLSPKTGPAAVWSSFRRLKRDPWAQLKKIQDRWRVSLTPVILPLRRHCVQLGGARSERIDAARSRSLPPASALSRPSFLGMQGAAGRRLADSQFRPGKRSCRSAPKPSGL